MNINKVVISNKGRYIYFGGVGMLVVLLTDILGFLRLYWEMNVGFQRILLLILYGLPYFLFFVLLLIDLKAKNISRTFSFLLGICLYFLLTIVVAISGKTINTLSIWSSTFSTKTNISTRLINGFVSYSSIYDFLCIAQKKKLKFSILSDRKVKNDKGPSPYHVVEIKVPSYSHYNNKGELILSFVNDQLVRTIFYPSDSSKYLETLRSKEYISPDQRNIKIPPRTLVELWKKEKNKYSISWSDSKLEEENIRLFWRWEHLLQ